MKPFRLYEMLSLLQKTSVSPRTIDFFFGDGVVMSTEPLHTKMLQRTRLCCMITRERPEGMGANVCAL